MCHERLNPTVSNSYLISTLYFLQNETAIEVNGVVSNRKGPGHVPLFFLLTSLSALYFQVNEAPSTRRAIHRR